MYLPDLPRAAYQDLLDTLDREFTYAFGGCTIVRDLAGSYLSRHGLILKDRINLLFTDTPLIFTEDFQEHFPLRRPLVPGGLPSPGRGGGARCRLSSLPLRVSFWACLSAGWARHLGGVLRWPTNSLPQRRDPALANDATPRQRLFQLLQARVRHLRAAKVQRLQALKPGQVLQARVRHLREGKVQRLQALEPG